MKKNLEYKNQKLVVEFVGTLEPNMRKFNQDYRLIFNVRI